MPAGCFGLTTVSAFLGQCDDCGLGACLVMNFSLGGSSVS